MLPAKDSCFRRAFERASWTLSVSDFQASAVTQKDDKAVKEYPKRWALKTAKTGTLLRLYFAMFYQVSSETTYY